MSQSLGRLNNLWYTAGMTQFDSIHSLAQTVTAGTVLFEEGTAGGGIVVLLSGRLSVLKGGHLVGTISEPGAYVGESTFVTGKMRGATVVAENSATIIRLSAQQSADFLQSPGAEAKMIRTVTQRLDSANDVIRKRAERITALELALKTVLSGLTVIHQDLRNADTNPEALTEVARQIRVLVNRHGTEDLLDPPIII